jgi:hypothetical protein
MPINGYTGRLVLLTLAAASFAGVRAAAAWTAASQQSAPPPRQAQPTPEAEGESDFQETLKVRGEAGAREWATRNLGLILEDGRRGELQCRSLEVWLRRGLYSYARAHGLPTDPGELADAYEAASAAHASGLATREAIESRFGAGHSRLKAALQELDRVRKQLANPPCPPEDSVSAPSSPPRRDGGLGKPAIIGGAAGAVVLGVVVLSGGGDSEANQPAPVNLSGSAGVYNGTVTYTVNSGCSRQGNSFNVAITVTLNADGSNLVLDVQGHRYQGTMRTDGSFEASFSGTFTFTGLFNSTGTSTITGTLRNNQVTAAGNIALTGGPCAGNQTQISITAVKN